MYGLLIGVCLCSVGTGKYQYDIHIGFINCEITIKYMIKINTGKEAVKLGLANTK